MLGKPVCRARRSASRSVRRRTAPRCARSAPTAGRTSGSRSSRQGSSSRNSADNGRARSPWRAIALRDPGPATPASKVASCESGSSVQKTTQSRHHDGERRPLARLRASDGRRRWSRRRPELRSRRMSRAQARTSLTSSSVSGKATPSTTGGDASETKAQPVLEALADAGPQPRFRVLADEAMVGQARGTDPGKDRAERRIVRRAPLHRRVRAGNPERSSGRCVSIVSSPQPFHRRIPRTPSDASHMRAKCSAQTVSLPALNPMQLPHRDEEFQRRRWRAHTPFAPTPKDAASMTAMAEAAGVVLAVHENFRFQARSPHAPVTKVFKALLPNS